jgi:hypothetical protein
VNIVNYHNNIINTYMKYLKMQTIHGDKQYWKKSIFFFFLQIVYARTVIFIFFVLFNDVRYLSHYCENNKKNSYDGVHHAQKNKTFVSRHRFYREIVPVTRGLLTSARAVTEKCWRKHCWQSEGDCSVYMMSE